MLRGKSPFDGAISISLYSRYSTLETLTSILPISLIIIGMESDGMLGCPASERGAMSSFVMITELCERGAATELVLKPLIVSSRLTASSVDLIKLTE